MRELVAASLFYMLCSAGMSVFNKLAVRAMPLPITLVVIQMEEVAQPVAAVKTEKKEGDGEEKKAE